MNLISLSEEEFNSLQEIKLDLTMLLAYYSQQPKPKMDREDVIKLIGAQINMISLIEKKVLKGVKL